MKKHLLIFIVLITLLGCQQKTVNVGNNISFKVENNVSYGKDPNQKMDIYLPEKPNKKNDVFIIIHGGGWRSGNKSQLTFFTYSLMEKFPGNVFVNMNYRLASKTRFALPSQTKDIENVMNSLEKKLKYKPRFILLGNSAGGHLSMFYANKSDKNKSVKAVINIVGPVDLNDPGFKNYDEYSFVEKHLIDPKIVDKNISMMDFGSPVHWINKNSPPALSFYGLHDTVVPLSQKKILDSALAKNSVYYESYEFNGDHLSWEKETNATFLISKIVQFMKNINKK